MKKLTFILILGAVSAQLCAQYKKANLLNKDGRTYSLTTTFHAMGDGKGTPIGFDFTSGADYEGKRTFPSWELSFIPGYKFSYQTKAPMPFSNGLLQNVTVSGKTRNTWSYGYNLGIHLGKLNQETKFHVYTNIGLNLVLIGKANDATLNDIDNNYSGVFKYPSDQTFTLGLKGGLGFLYNFTPGVALKVDGGYNYVLLKDSDYESFYHFYTSHPYVSIGVRFEIINR